ncbi:MAG: family 10 glycosylhydrolase, partial [Myxococcota bacterium]
MGAKGAGFRMPLADLAEEAQPASQPALAEEPETFRKIEKAPSPLRARGLWVLAEGSVRVLEELSRIDALLDRAAALEVTDLFVQVYRGGRSFYESAEFVEEKSRPNAAGVDVLRRLLEAAHQRGLRVHAWVNVLSLSTRREAKLIEDLRADSILIDKLGRSLLDYPNFDLPDPDRNFYRMGTPGLYLDPALPRVRARLLATFHDLLVRYPEFDGLHLDYIRHPGVLPFAPGSQFGVGL